MFFSWGDHGQPDISFVTDMARWWRSVWQANGRNVEQAGAAQGPGVMDSPALGSDTHGRVPLMGQATWMFSPIVLCLP